MIYIFPRLWHDGRGNNYARRHNLVRHPRIRAAMPHSWIWRPVRRLVPGVWIAKGQPFNLDDFGFHAGKG